MYRERTLVGDGPFRLVKYHRVRTLVNPMLWGLKSAGFRKRRVSPPVASALFLAARPSPVPSTALTLYIHSH